MQTVEIYGQIVQIVQGVLQVVTLNSQALYKIRYISNLPIMIGDVFYGLVQAQGNVAEMSCPVAAANANNTPCWTYCRSR